MKLTVVNGKPDLILFSTREIAKFEEMRYSYGNKDLPWRKKVIPVFGSFYIETLPSPLQQAKPGYLYWEIICIKDAMESEVRFKSSL